MVKTKNENNHDSGNTKDFASLPISFFSIDFDYLSHKPCGTLELIFNNSGLKIKELMCIMGRESNKVLGTHDPFPVMGV